MQIFRIEHPKTGWGLFRHSSHTESTRQFDAEYPALIKRYSSFPLPHEDGGLNLHKGRKEWFCAFPTLNDLLRWVLLDELKQLVGKGGYRVQRITIEDKFIQQGNFQVLFKKTQIKLLEDITDDVLSGRASHIPKCQLSEEEDNIPF